MGFVTASNDCAQDNFSESCYQATAAASSVSEEVRQLADDCVALKKNQRDFAGNTALEAVETDVVLSWLCISSSHKSVQSDFAR